MRWFWCPTAAAGLRSCADGLKMLGRTLILKHLLMLRETALPQQQLAVAASAQQRVGRFQVVVVVVVERNLSRIHSTCLNLSTALLAELGC